MAANNLYSADYFKNLPQRGGSAGTGVDKFRMTNGQERFKGDYDRAAVVNPINNQIGGGGFGGISGGNFGGIPGFGGDFGYKQRVPYPGRGYVRR